MIHGYHHDCLSKIIDLLQSEELTCVALSGGVYHRHKEKGVKPILDFIDADVLTDSIVVDRVVGRAAAMLYASQNPKHIHCLMISSHAIEVFHRYDISFSYEKLVDYIVNRTNTGMCPMERIAFEIADCGNAYEQIKIGITNIHKWLC